MLPPKSYAAARAASILERQELETLVGRSLRARQIFVCQILGSSELSELVFGMLSPFQICALSETCTSAFDAVARAQNYWESRVSPLLAKRFLGRLVSSDGELIVRAVKSACDQGFFPLAKTEMNQEPREMLWKEFQAACLRLEATKLGGYGNAVIVPREDICPHHVFRFFHVVSIGCHWSCTIAVVKRFLKLYQGLEPGRLNLRDNVGYVFKRRKQLDGGYVLDDALESVSHVAFMQMVRASNLSLTDIQSFFKAQNGIL